ncbi:LPS translocon maturation chaperone LptM [Magnetospirillum sp. ME-1]|uniref:LPS translocon maturation chaperone LptM n=1 Tax=Magnetospirillum sp. ME-1 TaxID=1639348 RepID=UPI001F1857BD|nr:lipoprotein [Magnetospirillum sp. ME-1]
MMMRSILVVALVVALAACGRKGMPERPDDAVYPRDYPYTPLPAEPKKKTPDPTTNSAY